MSTTTIRIDEELMTHHASAAARARKSPQAFILDALAETVERSEIDETLHRIADERLGCCSTLVNRSAETMPRPTFELALPA